MKGTYGVLFPWPQRHLFGHLMAALPSPKVVVSPHTQVAPPSEIPVPGGAQAT